MKSTVRFIFLFIAVYLVMPNYGNAQNAKRDSVIYKKAMINAMYPQESNVYKELISIDKSNKNLIWKTVNDTDYVLMVSWKGYIASYQPFENWGFYNTGTQWPIWTTAAPELLQRMEGVHPKKVDRRLKQMLGLPPNASYDYVVEFWVKPKDLFRPCPDNEINDTQCDVCFPADVDSTYKNWVNSTRIDRYYPCELYKQYPWTALGYTYDWNPDNKKHIGLSEFVIKNNANIVVNKIYKTAEYLKTGGYKK